jgi:hypothetical protein
MRGDEVKTDIFQNLVLESGKVGQTEVRKPNPATNYLPALAKFKLFQIANVGAD